MSRSESLEDEPRTARPATATTDTNIDLFQNTVMDNVINQIVNALSIFREI